MGILIISALQTGLLAFLATHLFLQDHTVAGVFMYILALLSLTTVNTKEKEQ